MKNTVGGISILLCWSLLAAMILSCNVSSVSAGFVGRGPRGAVVSSRQHSATALHAVTKKASKKGAKKAKKEKKAAKKAAAAAPPTFKKAEFVASVAEQTGLTKAASELAIAACWDTVREQVALGNRVAVPGFGTFTLKQRAARKGRNPQTGEEMDIPASQAPGFTASKTWKDELNGRR